VKICAIIAFVDPVSEAPASVEFGGFRILPHRREVLADGRPIELGGRTFDILMVLIEANGVVVSKDELMSRVWPGRIIEEGNLRAQIRALRMALADRELIRTVAGRGYQFTGVAAPAKFQWSRRLGMPPRSLRHACRSWSCPSSI
jgi:DNA-binding winged helix-turn-helix (wHTH) protein